MQLEETDEIPDKADNADKPELMEKLLVVAGLQLQPEELTQRFARKHSERHLFCSPKMATFSQLFSQLDCSTPVGRQMVRRWKVGS